jgi:Amt family ammonium transporter
MTRTGDAVPASTLGFRSSLVTAVVSGASAFIAAASAFAQEAATTATEAAATATEAAAPAAAAAVPTLNSGDTAWMLTSTALVLLMTIPGLALFYGGMVRKMNVLSVVMHSFAITCLISIVWMVAGYSLTFTAGAEGTSAYIGDLSKAFLKGVELGSISYTIPETVFVVFQMTFAIITPALIAGAYVDRIKFSAVMIFTLLWSLLVYVPVAHWVWGGGFLSVDGVLDFAGGTVVHINAGVAGLVLALMLGKRTGYGKDPFPPHNLTLSLAGASLLWVGWFGFNAGSAVAANGLAGMAMLVTQIAAAAAGLAWMIVEWAVKGKPSILGIISGSVAGLVAITPASGFVDPMGALIIGLVAGVICWWSATWLKHKLGYDDSLDAFGVHGVGGFVGAVLTGVFAVQSVGGEGKAGLIDGNAGQVWTQFYGAAIVVVYCAIATFIIAKVIDLVIGLRVDTDVEREGLDVNLHGEAVL